MKSLITVVTLLLCTLAQAGGPPDGYPIVNGVVKRVDKPTNRMTIKHEEIPNLNMPPMTMSFLIQDPSFFEGIAVGDKIHFAADEIDDEWAAYCDEIGAAPRDLGYGHLQHERL